MRAGAGSLEGTAAVIVRPATIERFGDIEPVINRACWCQYWRQTAAEYGPSTYSIDHSNWDRRREALRAQCAVEPVPGVIAYLGDLPVGWCGFGLRSSMKRLEGSRTIPKIDDVAVWSIVCFDVRRGYKRRGVATALLAGAIEYARSHGACGLEAYATDPAGSRRGTGTSYMGFTGMFEKAGFRRVVQTASIAEHLPRWLMRLDGKAWNASATSADRTDR